MDHLKQLNIDSSHIRQIDNAFTAQAMITTDQTNNQITAFILER
jgi:adenosine kinase